MAKGRKFLFEGSVLPVMAKGGKFLSEGSVFHVMAIGRNLFQIFMALQIYTILN